MACRPLKMLSYCCRCGKRQGPYYASESGRMAVKLATRWPFFCGECASLGEEVLLAFLEEEDRVHLLAKAACKKFETEEEAKRSRITER